MWFIMQEMRLPIWIHAKSYFHNSAVNQVLKHLLLNHCLINKLDSKNKFGRQLKSFLYICFLNLIKVTCFMMEKFRFWGRWLKWHETFRILDNITPAETRYLLCLDGGFFLAAVKIFLCGRVVILLQHLSASKFCYPLGFFTVSYVIVLKTVLKYTNL